MSKLRKWLEEMRNPGSQEYGQMGIIERNDASERPAEADLANCPFCGAVPRLDGPDSRTLIRVVCECGARGTTIIGAHGGSFDDAVAAWNRRAAEVERVWKDIISAWDKAKGPQGAPDMEWAKIAARAALNSRNDAPEYDGSECCGQHRWGNAYCGACPYNHQPAEPVAWRWRYRGTSGEMLPWRAGNWFPVPEKQYYLTDFEKEPLFAHPPEQSAAPPAAWKEAVEALEEIAKQKKTDELETPCDVEYADFEDGYDGCIDRARTAVEALRALGGHNEV